MYRTASWIELILAGSVILSCSTSADWQVQRSMPTARSEMSAAYLDGQIYVPGGLGGPRKFEVYDVGSDTWRSLANLPADRHHLMAVAHQGKIYVFGGADGDWSPTATAWVYELAPDRWKTLASMPEPRYAGAAVSLHDYIYVVGGEGPSGKTLRYDPKEGLWTTLAATRVRREHTAAVAFERKIVVVAGRYRGQGELNSVEIYDVDTDTWSDGPALRTARGGHAAVVHEAQVMAFGGEVILGGRETLADSEILDSLSGQWQMGVDLPVALHGMPVVSTGEALYILGGSMRAGAAVNRGSVYRFVRQPPG
jgi:N-acetylneuraminic acid mutarotase